MISILAGEVFDTKIIHTETKFGGSGFVSPQSGGVWTWMISMWRDLVDKMLVGQNGGLLETAHAFLDFNVNVTIRGYKSIEVVLDSHIFREIFVPNMHVFGVFHWRGKKMIFEVSA